MSCKTNITVILSLIFISLILESVCYLLNGNAPQFDRQKYEENVKQDTAIGTPIFKVTASCDDVSNNGAITYTISAHNKNSDIDYFGIDPESGWIVLKRALDKHEYHLQAIATHNGISQCNASVETVIHVVDNANNHPIWDQSVYGPIIIRENINVGRRVVSIKARSGIDNPTVFYSLIRGATERTNKRDTFYLSQRVENNETWADIHVNYEMDYEKTQQYNLTVRVENNGMQQLASETTVYIVLEDVNDEIPQFIATENITVLEGMPSGTKVTKIQAIDRDSRYPYNRVYYSIDSKDGNEKLFSIDRETGEIYTKVEFDREVKQSYAIIVRAEDGSQSHRPNMPLNEPNSVRKHIEIVIEDRNDNPPYFDQSLYEAEVNEDEDIHHTVITVTAKDNDESSNFRYEITRGNFGGTFAVNNKTGAVYVNRALDYESRKEYKLRFVASDGLNENYTTVVIHIKDINDNPPTFDRPIYQILITEEDDNQLPKQLLQVTATDGDRDRPQQIVYYITGEGIDDNHPRNSKFAINETTGQIYVIKPLDRVRPTGRYEWKFTVFAEDEGGNGLVGFADVLVQLKDINIKNVPFFKNSSQIGNVTENSMTGIAVMTITTTNYDEPKEGSNAKLKDDIEDYISSNNGSINYITKLVYLVWNSIMILNFS